MGVDQRYAICRRKVSMGGPWQPSMRSGWSQVQDRSAMLCYKDSGNRPAALGETWLARVLRAIRGNTKEARRTAQIRASI